MTTKKVSLLRGYCPKCDERDNYIRGEYEYIDDFIIVDSQCNKCGCIFKETFGLFDIEKVDENV